MTLRELFEAGYALHGMHWQRALARSLGVNERTVRWWLQADDGHRLPADLALRLDAIIAQRITELESARAKLKTEPDMRTGDDCLRPRRRPRRKRPAMQGDGMFAGVSADAFLR